MVGVKPGGAFRATVGVGCLPPGKVSRAIQYLPQTSSRLLILKPFMGNGTLAATGNVPHNFLTKYG
jgi:hypothetical protein